MAVRGYIEERQGAELVNPANSFAPGLMMDAYAVTQADSSSVPVIVTSERHAFAIGYQAVERWSGSTARFKLASLWRPFKPSPVLVLIVSGDATIDHNRLRRAFDSARDALSH